MVLLDRLEEPAPPLPLAARLDALRRAISEEHGLALRAAVNVLHTSLRREPPRKVGPREAAALRHVERVRRREERRQRAAALFPGDVTVGSPTESVGRGGGRGIDLEPSLGAGGVGSLGLLD